jgi:hypothetical protein
MSKWEERLIISLGWVIILALTLGYTWLIIQ